MPAQNRAIRVFVYSAGVLLLTTALAKILSALGNAGILHGPDPIFGIDISTVLFVGAAIEVAVARVCLRQTQLSLQVGLVLWLSAAFLLYRVGLWIVGYDQPCHCLGTLTDALNISPQATDLAMKTMLSYLLIGSCAAWLSLRKQSYSGSNEGSPQPVTLLQ